MFGGYHLDRGTSDALTPTTFTWRTPILGNETEHTVQRLGVERAARAPSTDRIDDPQVHLGVFPSFGPPGITLHVPTLRDEDSATTSCPAGTRASFSMERFSYEGNREDADADQRPAWGWPLNSAFSSAVNNRCVDIAAWTAGGTSTLTASITQPLTGYSYYYTSHVGASEVATYYPPVAGQTPTWTLEGGDAGTFALAANDAGGAVLSFREAPGEDAFGRTYHIVVVATVAGNVAYKLTADVDVDRGYPVPVWSGTLGPAVVDADADTGSVGFDAGLARGALTPRTFRYRTLADAEAVEYTIEALTVGSRTRARAPYPIVFDQTGFQTTLVDRLVRVSVTPDDRLEYLEGLGLKLPTLLDGATRECPAHVDETVISGRSDLFARGGAPSSSRTLNSDLFLHHNYAHCIDLAAWRANLGVPLAVELVKWDEPQLLYDVEEGQVAVTTLYAADPSTLALGGLDADRFELESGSGSAVLRFREAPDYENPEGRGQAGNEYRVTVTGPETAANVPAGTLQRLRVQVFVGDTDFLALWSGEVDPAANGEVADVDFDIDSFWTGDASYTIESVRVNDRDQLEIATSPALGVGVEYQFRVATLRDADSATSDCPVGGTETFGTQELTERAGGTLVWADTQCLDLDAWRARDDDAAAVAFEVRIAEDFDTVRRTVREGFDGDVARLPDLPDIRGFFSFAGPDGFAFVRYGTGSTRGWVRFKRPPDYEVPHDEGFDNVYHATASTSGVGSGVLEVTVEDVDEPAPYLSGVLRPGAAPGSTGGSTAAIGYRRAAGASFGDLVDGVVRLDVQENAPRLDFGDGGPSYTVSRLVRSSAGPVWLGVDPPAGAAHRRKLEAAVLEIGGLKAPFAGWENDRTVRYTPAVAGLSSWRTDQVVALCLRPSGGSPCPLQAAPYRVPDGLDRDAARRDVPRGRGGFRGLCRRRRIGRGGDAAGGRHCAAGRPAVRTGSSCATRRWTTESARWGSGSTRTRWTTSRRRCGSRCRDRSRSRTRRRSRGSCSPSPGCPCRSPCPGRHWAAPACAGPATR